MATWVHPDTHRIYKFLPHNPPMRGDTVLVEGPGFNSVRCRVVRSRVKWGESVAEGRRWELVGKGVKVKAI